MSSGVLFLSHSHLRPWRVLMAISWKLSSPGHSERDGSSLIVSDCWVYQGTLLSEGRSFSVSTHSWIAQGWRTKGDRSGYAVYPRNVWKWKSQGSDKGLVAMTQGLRLVLLCLCDQITWLVSFGFSLWLLCPMCWDRTSGSKSIW